MDGQDTQQQVQDQAVAPLVDFDKLKELFDERQKENQKVFVQEWQQMRQQEQQQAQDAEAQRQVQERAQQDAFGQVLAPYLGPVAQNLKFQADDTKDYVKFYTENTEAIERRKLIEDKFEELAKIGRAMPREDINAWFVGREKMTKDREEAAQVALQASTVASGVGQREALTTKSPFDMTKQEMEEFLGRNTF